MLALYIFLGIVLFFITVLSIPVKLYGEYFDSFLLKASWFFIHFNIYPSEKKSKEEKQTSPEKESVKDEAVAEKSTEENIFKRFYNNQGVDGVLELINNAGYSLGRFSNSLKKHFVFKQLYLWMTVSKYHDAGNTAIEYGKMCQRIFPAMSFICSNFPVRKYDIDIHPDFLGNKTDASFVFEISVRPIFIINAAIVLAFRLLFKVVIKFLKGTKDKNINKGGAL